MIDKEKALQNAIASMRFEGMEPSKEELERMQKQLTEEVSFDEVRNQILSKYK